MSFTNTWQTSHYDRAILQSMTRSLNGQEVLMILLSDISNQKDFFSKDVDLKFKLDVYLTDVIWLII